jgi:flagellar hook protein FlgE
MGLFDTLRTGASGLGVAGANLAVIGDNIANMNTTGFKKSNASFADQLPLKMGTLGGMVALGQGAVPADVRTSFSQGGLMNTGSALDVALTGSGFFMVNQGDQTMYTRDGSFQLDDNGYLMTSTGFNVQGYSAQGGQVSPTLSDMRIDMGPSDPKATTEVTMDMVLSPTADLEDNLTGLRMDGSAGAATVADVSAAADFTTSATVYDSLGNPHDVVVAFERVGESDWKWSAVVPAGETNVGEGDAALEIASGELAFDGDGKLASSTQSKGSKSWKWPGAKSFSFDLNLGGKDAPGGVRMQNDSETSSVTSLTQDGASVGSIAGLSVDDTGSIIAQYTNGDEAVLGQLALANFSAEGGLVRTGGNMYAASPASGEPAVGAPGVSGRGSVVGYALERSNVDLEAEFVSMIQAQRSYQANAGIIRTADETLQELVNLV